MLYDALQQGSWLTHISIHKSLQKLEFLKIFALKHAIIYFFHFFWLFQFKNFVNFMLSIIKFIKFKPVIKFKKFERHDYASGITSNFTFSRAFYCVRIIHLELTTCIHPLSWQLINHQTSTKVSSLPVHFCRLVTMCQRLRFVSQFWRYINFYLCVCICMWQLAM